MDEKSKPTVVAGSSEPKSKPKARAKAKPKVTQVKAEVEFKAFNPITGDKLSKPFEQYYTVEDWIMLQKHGPNRGLFVNKVIEAPIGVDTSYNNPGGKK